MVRRQVPLGKRIRANAGVIINAIIWVGAAGACFALYMISGHEGPMHAIALVDRHAVVVPESGRLATLDVIVGQTVQAGESLGTIEVPGLLQELAVAQAQLLALQAATRGDDPERERRFAKDVAGAQGRWLDAKVTVEAQRAELQGRDLALARLTTPGAAVAATEIEQQQAGRDALAREIALREEGVAALERVYIEARAFSGGTADAALEARVLEATSRVEMVRARLEASVLRAPTAGTIEATGGNGSGAPSGFAMLPVQGSWLQAGFPALAVVEGTTRLAVLYVSPDRARTLATGDPVTLETASGTSVAAAVVTLAPAVEMVPIRQLSDPTVPQWGVAVTVQTTDAQLMPGEAFSASY